VSTHVELVQCKLDLSNTCVVKLHACAEYSDVFSFPNVTAQLASSDDCVKVVDADSAQQRGDSRGLTTTT
jgi:hypothetical protein